MNQTPFDVRKIAIFRNKVLKDMIESKEMFFLKIAREIVQCEKHFLYRCEDLSLDPLHPSQTWTYVPIVPAPKGGNPWIPRTCQIGDLQVQ